MKKVNSNNIWRDALIIKAFFNELAAGKVESLTSKSKPTKGKFRKKIEELWAKR